VVNRFQMLASTRAELDTQVINPTERCRAAVRRALAEVPERQRECLLLRHSGYSYAEIAATLDLAVGSVGVLLARAEHTFRTTYRRQTHP